MARIIRFPDPSPTWLKEAKRSYHHPSRILERLVERVCQTEAGTDFHYRVRDIGRQRIT